MLEGAPDQSLTMAEPDFIFMLTRADRTIADALERAADALAAGCSHVGFKDVGLPFDDLARVAGVVKGAGATLYLEVVSLDETSETASARAALRLGVDVLMGGTRPAAVLPVIRGASIRYYPFAGAISGHPSILGGTLDDIVASARALAGHDGVHGLDLLAYRWEGDAAALITAVCASVQKPVVVAGSIDRDARIAAVLAGKAAGFTVGTAALDGVFDAPNDLVAQLSHIRAVARASV